MPATQSIPEAVLEVIEPDGSRHVEKITALPYLIGRGGEEGNHLQLADKRVSRRSAELKLIEGVFHAADRGQRQGVFVNGEKIEGERALREGDVLTLGVADTLQLIFHLGEAHDALPELLSRMENLSTLAPGARDLRQLSLLLEATALLQSGLPIEELLGAMVDRAIDITDADRGLLMEPDADGKFKPLVARQRGSLALASGALSPSQTVIHHALEQGHSVIEQDLSQAAAELRGAASVVLQGLRTVIAIPLFSLGPLRMEESSIGTQRSLLGVLYLDSRHAAAFSNLQRQILDALGMEAASVLDNARLLARERERRRLEQELAIARQIQQALLPRSFEEYPHLRVTGINRSCLEVGGDYFDLMPLGGDCTAFAIADVCGKGLGAALLTAMLQGSFASMSPGQDIAQFFTHINRFICSHSGVRRYATLFFGIVDPSGAVEFVNGGHFPPLLVRRGDVQFGIGEASLPVGLLPTAQYLTCKAQLEPGDTLVMVTDGITEAMSPEREEYGRERLIEVVKKCAEATVDEMQARILADVEVFTRGEYQSDDLTLLILRYEP